jgi:hypothetical protein
MTASEITVEDVQRRIAQHDAFSYAESLKNARQENKQRAIERATSTIGIMFAVSVVMALGGCAEFQAAKQGVNEYGSQAADEALDVAIWQMCQAATVGSVKRRFKTIQEINAYNAMCRDFLPVSPEE